MSFEVAVVLSGGVSYEHEVSRQSAQSMCEYLSQLPLTVLEMFIDLDGFFRGSGKVHGDSASVGAESVGAEDVVGDLGSLITSYVHRRLDRKVATEKICVIPALHGKYGEDGCLQGYLELAGLPYIGPSVMGSALGMHKVMAKKICEKAGTIPILPYTSLHYRQWGGTAQDKNQTVDQMLETLRLKSPSGELPQQVVIKPVSSGSSLGLSLASTASQDRGSLMTALEDALLRDDEVLIEDCLKAHIEIECAVIQTLDPQSGRLETLVSPAGVVHTGDQIFTHKMKYHDAHNRHVVKLASSDLLSGVTVKVRELSEKVFDLLGLESMARVDWFALSTGELYFNEVNTLPGMSRESSHFFALWKLVDLAPEEVLKKLLAHAADRHARAMLSRERIKKFVEHLGN